MKSIRIASDARVVYEMGHDQTAAAVSEMYDSAIGHLEQLYGAKQNTDVEIVICDSPLTFLFHALSGLRLIFARMTLFLWKNRVMSFYNRAGGVTLHAGGRAYIWIRPPEAYDYVDRTIGNTLFGPMPDPDFRLKFVFIHEMTHAVVGNRKLPAWINEGLAMYAADTYLKKNTVRQETLENIEKRDGTFRLQGYRDMLKSRIEDIAFTYAYGYWATRYIAENHMEVLQDSIKKNLKGNEFVSQIFDIMGIKSVWDLGRVLSPYFKADFSE